MDKRPQHRYLNQAQQRTQKHAPTCTRRCVYSKEALISSAAPFLEESNYNLLVEAQSLLELAASCSDPGGGNRRLPGWWNRDPLASISHQTPISRYAFKFTTNHEAPCPSRNHGHLPFSTNSADPTSAGLKHIEIPRFGLNDSVNETHPRPVLGFSTDLSSL